MKDEVPPLLVDAHIKNVEAAAAITGKVDPKIGLSQSGIAGLSAGEPDESRTH